MSAYILNPRLFLVSLIGVLCLVFPVFRAQAAEQLPDQFNSSIGADKTEVTADDIDSARVSITVRDMNLMPIENLPIILSSSRGSQDEISALNANTDSIGKARFLVKSLRNGTAILTAQMGGTTLQKTVTLTFKNGLMSELKPGDLIKIPDDGNVKTLSDTAVYYYSSSGKRYVFPNEKVYFSWYDSFVNVKIIPIEQMSMIPIAGNVTYKPGTRLVKFQTDPKTFIVTRGGVLRWAKTEDVARGWFGPDWNKYVDDISEAFYMNYTFGEPVGSPLDLAIDVIKNATKTIDQDKNIH